MIAVRYKYNKTEDETEDQQNENPETVIRETYENTGLLKCLKISARQLVENHFGNRFSFDSYGDVEKRANERIVVWRGEYLEGIRIKIFQKDGVLERVGIKYQGDSSDRDLVEIREILQEAGLKKRVISKKE